MKLLLPILLMLVALVLCVDSETIVEWLEREADQKKNRDKKTQTDFQNELKNRVDGYIQHYKNGVESHDAYYDDLKLELYSTINTLTTKMYPPNSNSNTNVEQQATFVTSTPTSVSSTPGHILGSTTSNSVTSTRNSFSSDNFLCRIFGSMYTNI